MVSKAMPWIKVTVGWLTSELTIFISQTRQLPRTGHSVLLFLCVINFHYTLLNLKIMQNYLHIFSIWTLCFVLYWKFIHTQKRDTKQKFTLFYSKCSILSLHFVYHNDPVWSTTYHHIMNATIIMIFISFFVYFYFVCSPHSSYARVCLK